MQSSHKSQFAPNSESERSTYICRYWSTFYDTLPKKLNGLLTLSACCHMKIEAEGVGKKNEPFSWLFFQLLWGPASSSCCHPLFQPAWDSFFSKNHSTTKPNSQRKAVTHSGSSGGQLTQNKEWKISYGVQTSAPLTTYVHYPLTVLRAYNHRNRSFTLFWSHNGCTVLIHHTGG
jgi:hypothetical protein